MTFKMQSALNIYLENIKIDYEKTCSSSQMKQEFNEGLHYAKGKKYIKVISGDRNGHKRVHSFISMGDDKFQEQAMRKINEIILKSILRMNL